MNIQNEDLVSIIEQYADKRTSGNPLMLIERYAKENNISTNFLCKKARVGRGNFTKGKSGSSSPKYSTIQRLAKTLLKLVRDQKGIPGE